MAKTKVNSSTDISAKLHLLGRTLVEMSIKDRKKAANQEGQGTFPGMESDTDRIKKSIRRGRKRLAALSSDPGTHQKGSRRQERATPRRRSTDPQGTRPIDKSSSRGGRGSGFDHKTQGTRSSDTAKKAVDQAVSKTAPAQAKTAQSADLFTAYQGTQILNTAVKKGLSPIKFKQSKAKKQNPHTATSPID